MLIPKVCTRINMDNSPISLEEYLNSIRCFQTISQKLNDGWQIYENENEKHKSYLKKETFVTCEIHNVITLCKVEYVIFFNLSYGVPSFSFNIWNSTGTLLRLEEIRCLSLLKINENEFYSVITQQEHPLFGRPYFILHPCHTGGLLGNLKSKSKNIIVTFLSLITPLLHLNLPMEYGL